MTTFVCFFFKQKTAYEVRISDWSSDVCSSDLPAQSHPFALLRRRPAAEAGNRAPRHGAEADVAWARRIGRTHGDGVADRGDAGKGHRSGDRKSVVKGKSE